MYSLMSKISQTISGPFTVFLNSYEQFISLKNSDEKYMLRFFPISQFEDREKEFAILKTVETYTNKAIKACEIGKIQDHGYMVTT
ncbi:UNVERIFIED_CONTAM: hypothetical protein BJ099_10648 [Lysinibacillus xylanilyticus]|uniref:hypothetical protein n=1 Tax=Lysinibacillus xylanilyticus TaxID=582475 RepID=UPI000670C435|nr:hypothetical protein [Lysinibacillus xylanilyticus]